MNPVSALIFDILTKRESINLPGIGSLRVDTLPGEGTGNRTFACNRVVLSRQDDPDAPNIVGIIARDEGIERDDAQEIYNGWLAGVCREEGVVIESVGSIRNDTFTPADELEAALNPSVSEAGAEEYSADPDGAVAVRDVSAGDAISSRNPKLATRTQIIVCMIVALLVGGGISAGIILWISGKDKPVPMATILPAAPSVPSATDTQHEPDTSGQKSTSVAQQAPSPAAHPASVASADIREVRYFTVIGTYSNEANADKFIASARSKADRPYYKLVLRNGKIMVYTFAGISEAEVNRARRDIAGVFPDAWVYRHRPR